MDKDEIKAIAIKWLDDGANAMAMRKWIDTLKSQIEWENDMRSQLKNPDRLARKKQFEAKREGMATIIDIHLTEWLDRHGYAISFRARQDVFTMAHQLLTGKEKIED